MAIRMPRNILYTNFMASKRSSASPYVHRSKQDTSRPFRTTRKSYERTARAPQVQRSQRLVPRNKRNKRNRQKSRFTQRALIVSLVLEILFIGALYLRSNDPYMIIEKAAFGCVLLWISNTDILWRTIPNMSLLIAALIRVVFIALSISTGTEHLGIIWNSLLGCVIIGLFSFITSLVSERLSGRSGLGGGDVKLLAVAGLYFGLEGGILVLFLACIAALASYVFHHSDDKTFPFAPAISIACAVVALI